MPSDIRKVGGKWYIFVKGSSTKRVKTGYSSEKEARRVARLREFFGDKRK